MYDILICWQYERQQVIILLSLKLSYPHPNNSYYMKASHVWVENEKTTKRRIKKNKSIKSVWDTVRKWNDSRNWNVWYSRAITIFNWAVISALPLKKICHFMIYTCLIRVVVIDLWSISSMVSETAMKENRNFEWLLNGRHSQTNCSSEINWGSRLGFFLL